MIEQSATSYEVRVWAIRKYKGKSRTTYTVRWTVGSVEFQKTFPTAKLAEGHRARLFSATGSGEAFTLSIGLPPSMSPTTSGATWLEHAVDFLAMKWPDAAPKYRKSLAESLTVITTNLVSDSTSRPDTTELRRALYGWIFTRPDGRQPVPDDISNTVSWLHSHSPPVAELADPARMRAVLENLALTIDGRQASNSTIAKRRSALHNCLDYAVERKLLASNPLAGIKRKRLPPTAAIDRRRVANPSQAQALLASVAENDPALEAFFATIYYAGARPGEVMNLRLADCKLPKKGWGELLLNSSYQRPGTTWTGTTDPSEERQLKHRAVEDTRPVPAHPLLVAALQRHLRYFENGVDGRLFVSRIGRGGAAKPEPFTDPVSMNTVYRAWHRARSAALNESEFASSLARRPYDLRHACLSTWLNAGVAPTQVAEWAGHSLNVLLSIYAKCIDGQQEAALRRIEGLFDGEDTQ